MPRTDGPGGSAHPWVPAPQDEPVRRAPETSIPLVPDAGTETDAGTMTDSNTMTDAGTMTTATRPSVPRSIVTGLAKFISAPKPRTPLSAVESLTETLPTDRLMSWIVTLAITIVAFFIRWYHLGTPTTLMFDETYYAKDAWSILQFGYEGSWGDGDVVNPKVALGDYSMLSPDPEWASHPEVGKFMIAIGEKLFGLNAFGWRFSSLIFGSLLVLLTIRLARRLSRSTLIGGIAGLLVCVDGMAFIMSRIALLDVFQSVFILAAVSCVTADRDFFRNRLARTIAVLPGQSLNGSPGPFIFRPWLVGAGVLFGLACGTKWNSMYPLAVFGILVVTWSLTARHLAGAGRMMWWSLVKDGVQAFVAMVILAVATYLVTWIPWLITLPGHKMGWRGGGPTTVDNWASHLFGQRLGILWDWHVATYQYHTGTGMEEVTHTYASNPLGWPLMLRTTGIYAVNGIQPGDQGCTAAADDTCLKVITAIGTPILWWAATLAIVLGLIWWIAGMDWRFGVAVLGMMSTWLPWVFSSRGAMFTFYTITIEPFMCIALAMVLGIILGPSRSGPRRQRGAIAVGVFLALVVLDFAFMYPVYTGDMMTRKAWQLRIWLPGWI